MSIANITGANNPAVMSTKTQQVNQDTSSLDTKIEQLQKQLEQIKENDKLSEDEKEKRIANIEQQIVQLEQQKAKESSKDSSIEIKRRFDTYEAEEPQQSAGLYKVTHDENGQQIIQVDKNQQDSQPEAEPQNEGEKPIIVKTTGNTDKVDREIEKLKQTQTQLQQKIAATKVPEEKESLEKQLAQVEAELKLKDNDTYRRQHMEITEQKVVSKIGE